MAELAAGADGDCGGAGARGERDVRDDEELRKQVAVLLEDAEGGVIVRARQGDGGVQVQPYAAPRSGGLWDDIRGQIRSSINSSGGLVEEADGSFGVELRAKVRPADGGSQLQPARFVGIDGPRWFLRAVFLGAAAQQGPAADALEAMVRGIVVVRGNEAMPVGSPIVLRLPQAT